MKKKLAVCVPTHEGAIKYIKDAALSGMLETYLKFDIDIYYYDSSMDHELEKYISDKYDQGFNNLHYIRMYENTFLDTKLERIFRCEDHICEYDYIWSCKSSVWADESTLEKIFLFLDKDFDIIVLNPCWNDGGQYPEKRDIEYDDNNIFFNDLGAYLTGMAFRIIKKATLLSNVDWNMIFDKYRVWVPNGTFYEIGLFFEQLSKLKSFHGILLSKNITLHYSLLKGKTSHWRGQEFSVWGECWPETIKRLPDCYTHKENVIKKKRHLSDVKHLNYLRQTGVLNVKVFFRYAKNWKEISDVSMLLFLVLSIKPRFLHIIASWKEEHFKKALYSKYIKCRSSILSEFGNGKKIVIYGAGEVGLRLSSYLKKDKIVQSMFVVTKRDIVFNVNEIPVVQIDELIKDKEDYCIIVGSVPRIQKEMCETLKKLGFTNVIFLR